MPNTDRSPEPTSSCEFPNGRAEILTVGGDEVGRYTFLPDCAGPPT